MIRPSSVIALFERQVDVQPSATALEVNDKSFTYAYIDSQANHLARQLKTKDIGRGDVVAICLRRTENLVIGLLGVLKAGAAYLPLNPSDPKLRLAQVISHAAARLVVTDAQSMINLPDGSEQVVLPEDPPPEGPPVELTDGGSDDVGRSPEAADLAYVIYTSGTTGVPKGVAITHGALANIVADIARRVVFNNAASWLAVTTVSFDIAALELFLPLSYGGRVILASEKEARYGSVLAGIIRRKKPTIMQATPITWRILLESGWSGSADLTILCGGERLDRDLANKLIARCSSLWNMYGPTETTIWSTADRVLPGEEVVTLGKPIANTEIHVLDEEGNPQGLEEIGEICIGGAGLARGYINDPDQTRQSFIDAHVGGSESTRLYRTGDLGRWNKQGNLEFHGRRDHQVKISGYRIELAEIEMVIRKYSGVADVAVLGVEDATHQKRLYGFVVAEGAATIALDGLVDHLRRHLPRYMVPGEFWFLTSLPSTSNGKRDIAALETIARGEKQS
jgi:amino acid adenylation domain-containing protein